MKYQLKLFNLSRKSKLSAGRKLIAIIWYKARGQLIPVAVQSKGCLCDRTLAGIADSIPAGRMDVSLFGRLNVAS
jgi:hypothetical protein